MPEIFEDLTLLDEEIVILRVRDGYDPSMLRQITIELFNTDNKRSSIFLSEEIIRVQREIFCFLFKNRN